MKLSMTTLSLLAMTQTANVSQPDIIWQPKLGKKKPKPRKRRGSYWTSARYSPTVQKPHSERNKKGRP